MQKYADPVRSQAGSRSERTWKAGSGFEQSWFIFTTLPKRCERWKFMYRNCLVMVADPHIFYSEIRIQPIQMNAYQDSKAFKVKRKFPAYETECFL